jgi:hypothetical protein
MPAELAKTAAQYRYVKKMTRMHDAASRRKVQTEEERRRKVSERESETSYVGERTPSGESLVSQPENQEV